MATKRYADDYETVFTTDEKGNEKRTVVYRGDYFEFSLDAEGLANFKKKCLLLLAAIIVLHINGGFVNNQGMNQFFVGLPYVFAFFPLLYLAVAILRLPTENRKYRRDEVGHSYDRMKVTSIILMVFLGIGVLGEIFFLVFFKIGGQIGLEYLYLLFEVPTAAASYFFIAMQRKVRVQALVKNDLHPA